MFAHGEFQAGQGYARERLSPRRGKKRSVQVTTSSSLWPVTARSSLCPGWDSAGRTGRAPWAERLLLLHSPPGGAASRARGLQRQRHEGGQPEGHQRPRSVSPEPRPRRLPAQRMAAGAQPTPAGPPACKLAPLSARKRRDPARRRRAGGEDP